MRNIFEVFLRDAKRLLRVPIAVVILAGLIILPCLYAWLNIIAFWDPYSDTKEIKIAVVNLDEGASNSLAGDINVGDQVVDQLRDNHDIGWQFVDQDEAMSAVKSGHMYAAIVIPKDFSKNLLTIVTPDFVQPELDYYVNEKANAIAPKITDTAAATVDTQVNSTFVSTVAQTMAQELEKVGVDTGDRLLNVQSHAVATLDEAVADVQSARVGLSDIEVSLGDAQVGLGATRSALRNTDNAIVDAQSAIAQTQALVTEVQQDLVTLTDAVTNAYVSAAGRLSEISSQVNGMIAEVSAAASQANVEVGGALNDVTAVVEANGRVIERLKELQSGLDPSIPGYNEIQTAIQRLETQNAADQELLANLTALNNDTEDVISAIQSSADAINAAIRDSADSASAVRDVLSSTLPDINSAMSAMSASAGAFSSALDSQRRVVAESINLLTALEGQLGDTVTALVTLDGNLADVERDLENVRTDVAALSNADIWNKVQALTGLNPDQIAKFMASPVQVNEHDVFPVPTYGSAMAPLFTNLSLWIGAFVLVVLIKQEVDTEGIEGLTVRQAYLGRWLLLAVLNVLQALLVSIGNIVIGVQMANAAAFVATSVFVGFVYLAIIYALAVSFGYIGKGIIILFVIMQIPGASGIYPIQMMPEFFQRLFPFFPFTHGIDAMRETIGGFYDGYYLRALAILAVFAVLSFFLGIFVRQRIGSLSRLFNRNLDETELYVAEDVQILGSRRRLHQMVQALTNREQFQAETLARRRRFERSHLSLRRLALLLGVLASVILLGFSWLFPDTKATVLGLWGVLCLLVIGTLVTLEYLKQNIGFATEVGEMPDLDLQNALRHEEAASHSAAVLDDFEANRRDEREQGQDA